MQKRIKIEYCMTPPADYRYKVSEIRNCIAVTWKLLGCKPSEMPHLHIAIKENLISTFGSNESYGFFYAADGMAGIKNPYAIEVKFMHTHSLFYETLIHELIHLKQSVKKEMRTIFDDVNQEWLTTWSKHGADGQSFTAYTNQYIINVNRQGVNQQIAQLPWETEAHGRDSKLYAEWRKAVKLNNQKPKVE